MSIKDDSPKDQFPDPRVHKFERLVEGLGSDQDMVISDLAELRSHLKQEVEESGYKSGTYDLEPVLGLISELQSCNDTDDKVSFGVKHRGRLIRDFDMQQEERKRK